MIKKLHTSIHSRKKLHQFASPILLFLSFIITITANSQSLSIQEKLDSLKRISTESPDDVSSIDVLKQIAQSYFTGIYQLDSAKKYGTLLYELGERIDNKKGRALGQYYLGRVADGKGDYATASNYLRLYLESEVVRNDTLMLANGLYSLANIFIHQGDLEEALNYQLQVLRLDEIAGDSSNIGLSLNNLGIIMKELNRKQEAIQYLERTKSIFENLGDEANVAMALSNLGGLYSENGDNNKALGAFTRSLELYENLKHERGIALALEHIGIIQGEVGDFNKALENLHQSLAIKKKLQLKKEIAESLYQLGQIHKAMHHADSARHYFTLSVETAQNVGDKKGIRRAYKDFAALEANNKNFEQAYNLFRAYHSMSDSILNESIAEQISQLETKYRFEKQEASINNLKTQQKLNERLSQTLQWALVATAFVAFTIIGFLFYRARVNKSLLEIQQKQTSKVEQAYDQLKSTQSQLIQSEKMASLGQLTAGIAHEIQNPLNFVNNFSEVNADLIDELKRELAVSSEQWPAGSKQLTEELIEDIKANEEKINHHGKRADAIVKGMLQHSRSSSGAKEPTDINLLCDEYIRLSYHGLRAKDKNFNAKFETDFDSALPKLNVVPQDIGRVVLNLINNAFYAVNESSYAKGSEDKTYQPTVLVRTKKEVNSVLISVKDNGNGIPEHIKEKIFQPFFTTKPAGQGTGLGLSLSYDIVKAHGGELKVETKVNKGTLFIIQLPILA